MGYRTYIGVMPKREYNKIKSLTKQQMYDFYNLKSDSEDEEPYKGVWEFGKELFEFGKYTEFNPPKKSMKPFFKKKDLKERYCENEFYIVTKEFFEYIIEHYTNIVKKYYSKMVVPFVKEHKQSEFLNAVKTEYNHPDDKYKFDFTKISDEEQTALFGVIKHVRDFAREWGVDSYMDMLPYDLKHGESICSSWKIEYSIFEFARIYKSFNWKKDVMIFYGY